MGIEKVDQMEKSAASQDHIRLKRKIPALGSPCGKREAGINNRDFLLRVYSEECRVLRYVLFMLGALNLSLNCQTL